MNTNVKKYIYKEIEKCEQHGWKKGEMGKELYNN